MPRLRFDHGKKRQLLQVHELRINQRLQLGLALTPPGTVFWNQRLSGVFYWVIEDKGFSCKVFISHRLGGFDQ